MDQGPGGTLRAMAERRVSSTLDLANLAEEVESVGRSDPNAVRSHVRRFIEHLLKLEFSPLAAPRADGRNSVVQARDEVEDHITASMGPDVAADLAKLFGRARRDAANGLRRHGEHEAAKALPAVRPYSLDQIVSHDWLPRNRHGIVDDLETIPEPDVALAARPRGRRGPQAAQSGPHSLVAARERQPALGVGPCIRDGHGRSFR